MFEANRRIEDLSQTTRPKVGRMVYLLRKAHIDAIIIETKRGMARQCYLYGKGRFLKKDWERAYIGYDDPNISSEPKAKKVTWTLRSRHLSGDAIDIVPTIHGEAWWDAPKAVWDSIYAIAEKCGLVSCWKKNSFDRPHISSDGN